MVARIHRQRKMWLRQRWVAMNRMMSAERAPTRPTPIRTQKLAVWWRAR